MKLVYPFTRYKTEENQLKQQQRELLAQAERLQGFLAALLETCQGIFERIWWPHWLRILLTDVLPPFRQKLQDHLDAYVAALKEASLALWSEHDTLPVRDTLLETSRPSTEQAKKLYTRMTEDIDWSEHARHVPRLHSGRGQGHRKACQPERACQSTSQATHRTRPGLRMQTV